MLEPFPRFIAQIIAIVVVARVIGRATRGLGQPMVVAEITAGILLGPSVLGWLAPECSQVLFAPDSLELLQVTSDLGLVLFMFLVGLEFDSSFARGRSQAALVISLVCLVVSLGLGVLLGLHLHPTLAQPGVSWVAYALFLGVALSTTAFPVLARILSERRFLRSRVGTMTITCAAIDNVIAWCVLAFVVAWVRGRGLTAAAVTSLLAVAYVAVMILGVRPLLRRLARAHVTGAELTHDRVAAVLVLLFASAWATHAIGVHALFGAFILGAILPREAGLAHALADKLADLVIVVLMPLFFAYSGVRTQIGLLDSTAAWMTCGLIVAVACVGKFGAGTFAARLTGLSWRESGALGILMNTRGLVVLIVLNIGLDLGIIGPTLFTMLVLMALFTTFIATPVLDVVYPFGQHVKELLTEDRAAVDAEPEVAPVGEAAFTLLLCVDRPPGRGLLALAAVLADASTDTRMHGLHLRTPADPPHADRRASASAPLEFAPGVKTMSFVSVEPARDIIRLAEVKAADLVLFQRPASGAEPLDRSAQYVLAECRSAVAILFDGGGDRVARALFVASETADDHAALELAGRLLDGGVELTIQRGAMLTGQASPVDVFMRTRRRASVIVRDPAESRAKRRPEPRFDLVLLVHGGPQHQHLAGNGTSVLIVRAAF